MDAVVVIPTRPEASARCSDYPASKGFSSKQPPLFKMALGAISHCNCHWKRAWTAQNGRRPFETPEGRMRLCHSSASANTLTLSNDGWCQVLTCWMASDGHFESEFLKRSLPNMWDALPINSFHWAGVWHICFTCKKTCHLYLPTLHQWVSLVYLTCLILYHLTALWSTWECRDHQQQ